ncbi:MAG: DUF2726 domain-containing protein [Gammaproteobacteria bacterium]|nr:DUF2726 domain-containing protein [Gammaproteobacteria bacterium]
MELFYLLFVLMLSLLIAVAHSARNRHKTLNASLAATLHSKRLLSDSEQVLYWTLVKRLNEQIVLPKVSLSKFLFCKGTARDALRRKLRRKVADYVICNKDFAVQAIVELEKRTSRASREERTDRLLSSANIPVFRISARHVSDAKHIANLLSALKALQPANADMHLSVNPELARSLTDEDYPTSSRTRKQKGSCGTPRRRTLGMRLPSNSDDQANPIASSR